MLLCTDLLTGVCARKMFNPSSHHLSAVRVVQSCLKFRLVRQAIKDTRINLLLSRPITDKEKSQERVLHSYKLLYSCSILSNWFCDYKQSFY